MWRRRSFHLIALIALLVVPLTLAAASAPPKITWSVLSLDVTLSPGSSASRSVSFTSSQPLSDVALQLVPEIDGFATLDPTQVAGVSSSQAATVTIAFSVPSGTEIRTYEGTLHVRSSSRTIPQTLKIRLNVVPVSGPTWARFEPIGNGPLSGGGTQSTAYDVANDRLIVFGGEGVVCCIESNDTWVLVNATGSDGSPAWVKLSPLAPAGLPPARHAHSAVYDPVSNRMIIFGGGRYNGWHFDPLFNDAWVLTNANGQGGTPEWIPLLPAGTLPAPREGQAAFYRPGMNQMLIFDGGDNGIMSVPNDMWLLSNANGLGSTPEWSTIPQSGAVPWRLEHFAFAFNPVTSRLTIAGGCCGYTNASHSAALDGAGAHWSTLSPAGPLPPGGDALVYGYDPGSDRMIVHGISPGGGGDSTWLLTYATAADSQSWINTIPAGAGTAPAQPFALLGSGYHSIHKKLVVAISHINPDGSRVPEVWVLSNADEE